MANSSSASLRIPELLSQFEPLRTGVARSTAAGRSPWSMRRPLPGGRPDLPPRCAAVYAVVRAIGTGGFGAVWLARHRGLDRMVALKLLHGEVARQESACERFANEARVTAQLNHPNIVRLLDHDSEDGRAWIAYEYLGETSVQTLLDQRGILSTSAAVAAGAQIAGALGAAHALGIVHRDLKPDNVIAVEPGLYKLIDFGVAAGRLRSVKTGANQVLGTPAYLSPEQLRCEPPSPQSDEYQLGLLVYQMISGQIAHKDENLQKMLVRRLTTPPAPLSALVSDVSPEVEDIVSRMLAPDPADRYPEIKQVRLALERALARMPESSTGRKCATMRVPRGGCPAAERMTRMTRAHVPKRGSRPAWGLVLRLGLMSLGGCGFLVMVLVLRALRTMLP